MRWNGDDGGPNASGWRCGETCRVLVVPRQQPLRRHRLKKKSSSVFLSLATLGIHVVDILNVGLSEAPATGQCRRNNGWSEDIDDDISPWAVSASWKHICNHSSLPSGMLKHLSSAPLFWPPCVLRIVPSIVCRQVQKLSRMPGSRARRLVACQEFSDDRMTGDHALTDRYDSGDLGLWTLSLSSSWSHLVGLALHAVCGTLLKCSSRSPFHPISLVHTRWEIHLSRQDVRNNVHFPAHTSCRRPLFYWS